MPVREAAAVSAPTPALDFLEKVRTWQDADGTSAGLPVLMPGERQDDLTTILDRAKITSNLVPLEDRARRWLIGYRELVEAQGGLTPGQRQELDSIVACIPLWDARQRRAQGKRRQLKPWQQAAIGAACLLAGFGAAGLVHNANPANPGAGASEVVVTGKLCAKDVDPGAQATYYLTMCGTGGKPDVTRVYTATSAVGPSIVLAKPGDDVTFKVLKANASNSRQQIEGFSDRQHPVGANS